MARGFRQILLLILVLAPQISDAQPRKQVLKSLFYDIPIDLGGRELIARLKKHPLLSESPRISATGSFGFNYRGSIDMKALSTVSPDEAQLMLSGNLGYLVDKKKDIQTSDLQVEYVFSSEALGEAYFNVVWDRIKHLSKDTSDAQFGFPDEADFAYGKSIKLYPRRALPELYLLKKASDSKLSVLIIYRRDGY